MSWCTSGVRLQVLPFIDNSHGGEAFLASSDFLVKHAPIPPLYLMLPQNHLNNYCKCYLSYTFVFFQYRNIIKK